jgi:SAM-dependent methyltransferase
MSMNWRVTSWPPEPLLRAYKLIPETGAVLDVGSWGCHQVRIANHLGITNLKHHGVDYSEYPDAPPGFIFKMADLNKEDLPYPQDSFDFVVARHVMEHLQRPVEFFGECLRVCKPGGLLYFEAPSERALWLPGMPFKHEEFYSLSFFDDPTHSFRPWTPQSFYRLSKYYGCEPIMTGHLFSWIHRLLAPLTIPFCLLTKHQLLETCVWQTIGWASYLVVRKPSGLSGTPPFKYYIPGRPYKIRTKAGRV